MIHPEPFLLLGIDVAQFRIVGLKSSAHFRAGFSGVAKHIVTAKPAGDHHRELAELPLPAAPAADLSPGPGSDVQPPWRAMSACDRTIE